MKYSIHYALAYGSDISEKDRDRVVQATWENMRNEGAIFRGRVEAIAEQSGAGPFMLLDNFDYALVGITDAPYDAVIYDYWRCVEVLVIHNRLSIEEAKVAVEELIEKVDDMDNGPMFMIPVDYLDEEEQEIDDYDILNAHEVVFPSTKSN